MCHNMTLKCILPAVLSCIDDGFNPKRVYIKYRNSALGPVWAETRAQSGGWYGSGTLHPGHVLRDSLPLFSPIYVCVYIYIYI